MERKRRGAGREGERKKERDGDWEREIKTDGDVTSNQWLSLMLRHAMMPY